MRNPTSALAPARLLATLLLALLLSPLAPAWAQAPAGGPKVAGSESLGGVVRVEGRRLFNIGGSGGSPATERAARINSRLDQLVQRPEAVTPFAPEDVATQNGEQVIILGGERIMTVTAQDAEDALSRPRELALTWGAQMARAVADARTSRASPVAGTGILIRNSFRDLIASVVSWLPRLAGALLLALLFWALARLGAWATRRATRRLGLAPNNRDLLRALTSYGVWAAGAVAILSTLGIESGSIAAAVGVSGFVIGFASKDILSHFLAGLLLLLSGQIRVGDQVVIREFEGTVERIELRATHLRTYDNRLVVIPNADVFVSIVTLNTASSHRRRSFGVCIGYGASIARARQVALEAVRGRPGVLDEPEPAVLVDDLGASAVSLRVAFSVSSQRIDYVRVGADCMEAVKDAFEREGIPMPSDPRTLAIRTLDGPAPEEHGQQDGEARRGTGAST